MRVRLARLVFVVTLPVLAAAGCAGAPSQEMSDARQAIKAARIADAAAYAPRSLDSAERLLDDAQQSLKAGKYEVARNDALAARQAAMLAREVATAIGEARQAVEEAKARGAAWQRSERLLDEAEAAARRGEEGKAVALAMQAKRSLQ